MREKKGKIDYWLFFIVFVLCCIGMIMVLSASQYSAAYEFGDSYYYLKRQIFNIAVGFVAMFLAIKIDYRIYGKLCWPIFFAGVALMLLVMLSGFGAEGGGSERWIQLGPIRFQPSDVMKLSMLVLLCQQLAEPSIYFAGKTLPYLIIVGISCIIVAINDLGTGIVMGGTAMLLLIIGGMKLRYLFGLFGAGLAGVAFMVALRPYRLKRLTSFLDPWADYYGNGYQVVQSLLAIGSGGLMGVGLGEGGAKWFYLPERHTDFIFAILVEEGGLLAGLVLLLLFLAFTWRGLTIAMRVKDSFGRLMAAGLTLMITVQALVNIAIALGMMPVTGITLPFISYGGTSLVISLAAVGVLLNISKSAKMKK
ncbi:MAG TPA: putative lipid II flippase FtsW [Candidatus Avidehalobacter gallistercoris]|uniref:Probable peptidoglycan glycosyltransferase FtsW n=1 Tax=Candidatus Avidehalobacter gallistercoris TaxID=2840694 RepID=A0A9D1KZV4_9FIRM|nr:putative lipid II flippase FtsW [Candidatus Avidehalobacter gallistercoris]